MTDKSFWDSFSSGFSSFTDGISDFFNVGSTISPSSNMSGDDVLKTKSALNAVGSYQPPFFGITEVPDHSMIDGLKKFQANSGLKVDGIMKPGGPTENALGQTLAKQGISSNDLFEKAKAAVTPEPSADPDKPQTSWSASASFKDGSITNLSQPASKRPKVTKIDPMTGLVDPLASAPKGKIPTAKQWEGVVKMQQQKASNVIIPQGDTVKQRVRPMLAVKMDKQGDAEKTPQGHSYQTLGISKSFRDELFERESKGSGGYNDKHVDNSGKVALGRYQLRVPALIDAGFMNNKGAWTGKGGVKSDEEFLNSPQAQELALNDFMKAKERQVKNTGAFDHIGTKVKGVLGDFKITKSGLMSAAHRQGQRWVAKYLKFQNENGWKSDFSKLDSDVQTYFKRVEKALRTFEGVPYED